MTTAAAPRAIACLWRRLTKRSSNAPAKKNTADPSTALERLEWWSWTATIVIFFGIVVESAAAIHFWALPPSINELLARLAADAFIGVGLLIEAVSILRAIVWARQEKLESDEKVAAANERAVLAAKKTEELRHRNLLLEFAVLPRILESHSAATKLGEFSGQTFVIDSIDDHEPQEIANRIRRALELAGWKPSSVRPIWYSPAISDGIAVYSGGSEVINPSQIEQTLGAERTRQAATALVGVLTDNRIFVRPGPVPMDIPEPVVLIQVGRKPLPPGLQPGPQSPSSGE